MKTLFAFVVALLIGGCAQTPQPEIPAELQYVKPSEETSAIATVQGSQVDSSWADDFTAYVLGVDGKRVMVGRAGWNERLPIIAGTHNIAVSFQRGIFTSYADMNVTLSEGRKYQVRFATDVEAFGPKTYCDFWIIDMETQKAVTKVHRSGINGASDPAPVFIPIFY